MKQKNLFLVAVAVACGLAAAVLTSMVGPRPRNPETTELMVALKDIPVGTKITKDNIHDYVGNKKFPKDSAPLDVVEKDEELVDKYITRTKLKDEPFNKVDVAGALLGITPPAGMTLFPIRSTNDTTSPFIHPGSKVDLLCTLKLKGNADQTVVFPILTDMLIMAINTDTTMDSSKPAYTGNQVISLATTSKQSILLKAAVDRGASIMLLPQGEKKIADWNILSESDSWALLSNANLPGGFKSDATKTEDTVKTKYQLLIATKYLPTGTQLTQEVLDSCFKKVDVTPPVPTNFLPDLKEYAGKYLTSAIEENQFIPKSFIGEKPVFGRKPPEGMEDSSKEGLTVVPPQPNKELADTSILESTVQSKDGIEIYVYEVNLKTGQYKFRGKRRSEGQGVPTDGEMKLEVN